MVGRPGKFVGVQVKCTIAKLKNGKGYICQTCSRHKPYRAGAFDFLAAYVIPEDVWYIIPAKKIRGMNNITLCTQADKAKYEQYREAWGLLHEAAGVDEEAESSEGAADEERVSSQPTGAMARMEAAANFFERYLERGGLRLPKRTDEC